MGSRVLNATATRTRSTMVWGWVTRDAQTNSHNYHYVIIILACQVIYFGPENNITVIYTVLFDFRLGLTLTTGRVTYSCTYAALFPTASELADPFAVIRGGSYGTKTRTGHRRDTNFLASR